MPVAKPWWETDTYNKDAALHPLLLNEAGPNGVALVRAFKDGKTDAGWGGDQFMDRYNKHLFDPSRKIPGYDAGQHAVAVVMRSVRLVCIDVDGKNGGLDHVGSLGALPPTLAETSKSGNGYHLFYATTEDEWDDEKGFALFRDRIGIKQGVDIRATGCVYHHHNQRWNKRPIAELPVHLATQLREQIHKAEATVAAITKILDSGDQEEVLIMQDQLTDELKKPIPEGKRNNTLFAIGSQMYLAQVPMWDAKVYQRAIDVGLDDHEAVKLVANIKRYAA
jgi:hypothetical protein